jgi:hypothetical protein
MEHGKDASKSIETMRSEINLTDALPHTRELACASLEAPFGTCPIASGWGTRKECGNRKLYRLNCLEEGFALSL